MLDDRLDGSDCARLIHGAEGTRVCGDERGSGYETFEHTADVGLKVRGATLRDLFEQAAAGFINVMFDTGTINCVRTMSISARGGDPEELLVAWLEEILFAVEADGFAPAAVRVTKLGPTEVAGELTGEDFDPERHHLSCAVKAVTYHDLKIRRTNGACEVSIVFDV
ncbi:MAG: archease [Planctomycetota bacterium]